MSKKRKNFFVIIISVVIISAIMIYFSRSVSKENAPEYIFTYAENHPDNYPTTLGAFKFAELVEEKTNGRIKIIVQSGGMLGDEKTVIEQVKFGGIDFTRVSISPLADTVPILNVLQLPYIYRNSDHMWKVLDGEIGQEILSNFDQTDMVGLSWYDAGARNFYNEIKPITCIEDMKGMRIRVQESDMMADMVKALGAIAEPLAYGDVYCGLQTGIIDGAENNWPSYESQGHYEVAKYYTVDEHTRVPEMQLCARATWEKLSDSDKDIILSCARESAIYERAIWKEREKESEDLVKKKGVQVTTLSIEEKKRFSEAVQGLYEVYCKDYMDLINRIKNTY